MYIEIVINCNERFTWEKKSKFKEGPDAGQDVGGLESKRRNDLSEENRSTVCRRKWKIIDSAMERKRTWGALRSLGVERGKGKDQGMSGDVAWS